MELLELWQVALSADSVTALDLRRYMTTSLVRSRICWRPEMRPLLLTTVQR